MSSSPNRHTISFLKGYLSDLKTINRDLSGIMKVHHYSTFNLLKQFGVSTVSMISVHYIQNAS